MSELTPAKKATIDLIHRGYRNLEIAREIADKFDLLGDAENELFLHIENTRREIEAFRAQAPALAELGFSQGYGWKEVVAAIESPGLLSSFEVTQICVAARNKVQAEPSGQTLPEVDNETLNKRLIAEALRVHPTDETLLGILEQNQEERTAHEQAARAQATYVSDARGKRGGKTKPANDGGPKVAA